MKGIRAKISFLRASTNHSLFDVEEYFVLSCNLLYKVDTECGRRYLNNQAEEPWFHSETHTTPYGSNQDFPLRRVRSFSRE